MKMLFALLGVLCLTGTTLAAAAGEDCTTTDDCDANLDCQGNKCRHKIGASCAASTDNLCPLTADGGGACPADGACACPASGYTKSADEFKCLKNVGQGSCVDATAPCVPTATCTGGNCECASGKTAKSDNTMCLKDVDQTGCDDTTDPCVPNAKCQDVSGTKTCKCEDGKSVVNGDKSACLMISGQSCTATSDCIANAECPSSGAKNCKCMTNYLASFDDSECKIAVGGEGNCAGDGDKCGRNADCNSENKCACKTGFGGGTTTELCSITDGKNCDEDEDCKKGQTCKDIVDNKGTCSGAAVAMASMLLLLAAFVGTRWI